MNSRKRLTSWLLITALTLFPCLPSDLFAQGETGDLKATITSTRGIVQVRMSEAGKWQRARVGMILDQGAEFRTGPRSAVQFTIPPGQTITLDRLGTCKVLQAVQRGNKVVTNVGMKYGRTRYNIAASGVEHESSIHTTSATLAVRGTNFFADENPAFSFRAGTDHPMSITDHQRGGTDGQQTSIGSTDGEQVEYDSEQGSAAETENTEIVVDAVESDAQTNTETQLATDQPVARSNGLTTLNFKPAEFQDIQTAPANQRPPSNPLDDLVRGLLEFTLNWTDQTTAGVAADLDLHVIDPQGGIACTFSGAVPGCTVEVGHGQNGDRGVGRASADHPGPNGVESIRYDTEFFPGQYTVGVTHFRGQSAADFSVNVDINGQQIPNGLLTGTLTPAASAQDPRPTQSFNVDIQGPQP